MARRRFEMHHYRQTLLRMRQGDSDRQIAQAKAWADALRRGGLNPEGTVAKVAILDGVDLADR